MARRLPGMPGGALKLTGASGGFVNLPGGLVSGSSAVTIEFWAAFGANGNWARVFDFGNIVGANGSQYLFFSPHTGTGTHRTEISAGSIVNLDIPGTLDNRSLFVACIIDPANGYNAIYTNGVLEEAATATLPALGGVNASWSFIGRSLFSADPWLNATIDEFRIYDGRLTPEQITTDYRFGPARFRNAFLDGPSNASDVINSVLAARAAVPQLGARWIVMGEAEGALAATGVAEKENEVRDPNYLGGIAISVLASARESYEHSVNGSSSAMLPSLAYGVKTVYPQFQVTDILTVKALPLYNQLEQTCSQERTTPELSLAEIVKPGWETNPFVRKYFDRNEIGQTRAYSPIFVITGDADPAIPPTTRAQSFARMCKQGDRVQWERYPGLDSGRVIGESVRDQIGWIEARFAGRASPTNCP